MSILNQLLLYSCLFLSSLSLFLALIACARVGKVLSASQNLNWDDVANLTGDIATVKKKIQTLNNRMNGMRSPKLQEQELMLQLLNNQQKQQVNGKLHGG